MSKSYYTLFKRNGIYYYYVEVNGKRKRVSTKLKSKKKAHEYCQQLINNGLLICDALSNNKLFGEFTKNWFIEDLCPYVKEKRRNGSSYQLGTILKNRCIFLKHILPSFDNYIIAEITSHQIDEWKYSLVEQKGLSRKTANNILSILRTIFDYAYRHDYIKENPCLKVKQMSGVSKAKGVLTEKEAIKLFNTQGVWSSPVALLMNLLAATTGMRMGEIRALRQCDINIKGEYIIVEHSFDHGRLKCTKTGIVRAIPVATSLIKAMRFFYHDENSFVFNCENTFNPVGPNFARLHLNRALEKIGVSLDEQRRRNITFHSWRHYLNSRLRTSGIPDAITRHITGHVTEKMTDHYSHYTAEDCKYILEVSKGLVI